MGSLISGHFMKELPDIAAVKAVLPASLGCRLLSHRDLKLFAIDTYRAAKARRWPLAVATPATDLPLELPESLSELTALYERLLKEGGANGLKRAYINLSRLLSELTRQPVLTLYSDDDGNDFACLGRSGELVSLLTWCGEYLVQYEQGGRVLLKPRPSGHRLHALASFALRKWFGIEGAALGLGTLSPPEAYGFAELPAQS